MSIFVFLFSVGCSTEAGYCEVTETSIDAEQETSLGYTSQELISSIPSAGTHGLQWQDDSNTCLSYTIELDPNTTLDIEQTPVQGKTSLGYQFFRKAVDPVITDPVCEQYVSIGGVMTLSTTDGEFDEEMPIDVEFSVDDTGIQAYFEATTSTIKGTYEPDCDPQDCYENASIEFQFLGSFSDGTTAASIYVDKTNDDGSRGGWSLASWGTEYDHVMCE